MWQPWLLQAVINTVLPVEDHLVEAHLVAEDHQAAEDHRVVEDHLVAEEAEEAEEAEVEEEVVEAEEVAHHCPVHHRVHLDKDGGPPMSVRTSSRIRNPLTRL